MSRIHIRAAIVLASLFLPATAHAICHDRPTDPSGYQAYEYGSAEVKSHATARVRVHWATSGTHAPVLDSTRTDGVPDTVVYAADTAEQALSKYAEMGFRPVPSDASCASNGGDGKLDIYLVSFTGADGACVAECTGTSCSSFALVESTFRNRVYANAQEGFRTVVTHELFHAVQNAYKPDDDPYWAEGTAQWAMKTVHPELQDFERNLPSFFAEPMHSIDTPPTGPVAGYLYGSAVWPLFLSLNYKPDVIRDAFEHESGNKQTPLAAVDAVLLDRSSSLAQAYPLFAAWNAATGSLAGTGGYPDAAKYPGIKTEPLADGASEVMSGVSYFVYRGILDASKSVEVQADLSRIRALVVPLENGKARLDQLKDLPANVEGEVLVVVAGISEKKTDAKFTIRIGDPLVFSVDPPDGCRASPRAPVDLLPMLVGLLLIARFHRKNGRSEVFIKR
jgi:hypothetical protein